jgi:uncharacterized pyridoxamine 5'-phosphate oxidase family protein
MRYSLGGEGKPKERGYGVIVVDYTKVSFCCETGKSNRIA